MNPLQEALKQSIEGEVRFDTISKKVYSVDASIYEIEPIGIVLPRTKEDLVQAVKTAYAHKIPVIARGAATGITGGCLGKALILDVSKYLNRILEINITDHYAICEPGVTQSQLNQALAPFGFLLGPETSTGNRATIGGMLGNNSAGARSLRYGKMVDHVLETELLLASGELLRFRELSPQEWQEKTRIDGTEGRIYRTIDALKEEYGEEIQKRYPDIPRRVDGYNLDRLLKGHPLNVCQLITGSEGTLGIATEIKVRIVPKPKATALCLIHFHSLMEAMQSVMQLLEFHPSAIEMIDDRIIEAGRSHPALRGKLQWLNENPKVLFAVEFDGNSQEEVDQLAKDFEERIQTIGYARHCLFDPVEASHVWTLRKSGLGLLLSKRSYSRAIAFIEDVSVAPEELPQFMETFLQYLREVGKEAGMYGHVGSGCLHLRPYMDLRDPQELKLMRKIMVDVAELVVQHRGALSGEHGDGLLRSWLLKTLFGEKIEEAFRKLKAAFDPDNRMNPGKIVHAPKLEENLRLDPDTRPREIETFLDFSKEGGFSLSADLCNGNGMCRKPETLMCPSFQVTGDEYHTTRARAQAFRSVVNGRLPLKDLTSEAIYDVLDLCVSCKGCKTECPSQVDMAKMKAEFLYQYQEKHGYSLRSRLFAHLASANQLLSPVASLANHFNKSAIGKKILSWAGIAPERTLPPLATTRFSEQYKEKPSEKNNRVVLFNDTYTEYNYPEIGKSAVKVLNRMGYEVIVPSWSCCGRPLITKGFLKKAREQAKNVLETLQPYISENLPIIGLEPSCILTIIDDHPDLIPGEQVQKLAKACVTFDEFIANHMIDGKLPFSIEEKEREILLHGHCHQKALVGTTPTMQILRAIPGAKSCEILSGCCGMAGSFGYEKEHFNFSMQIGELHLFPAVRNSDRDTILVANGLSCRSQISDGTGRKALHLAEFLSEILE